MILVVDLSRMLLGEADDLDARHSCSSRNICCRPHLAPLILLLFPSSRSPLLPPQAAATLKFPWFSRPTAPSRRTSSSLATSSSPSPSTASDDPRGRLRQQEHHVRAYESVGEAARPPEEDVLLAVQLANCRRDVAVARTRRHLSGVRLAGNTRLVENQRCKDGRIDHAPGGSKRGVAAGDARVYRM